ncbi:MAG: SDR family oxidoreductase [Proteobacteria bacterium]|jgi:3(or 17)beta-hydroxysteroid dehydrogenase|nr:SDR family oxidoreductase [Pseudomonadota bacterium]
MTGRVEGKVCVVTGGAMGLGEADCRLLAREGGKVIIADIADEKGNALAAEIGAEYYHLDVTKEAAWVDLMAHIKASYGKLNVLVNNAGIAGFGHVENTSETLWRKVNAVSTDATFFGMKHAIPLMRDSGEMCSIVNMSSVAGIVGTPYVFAYCAAKGAVRLMSKAAAVHCAQLGDPIRVNSVHPGAIETPMTTGAHAPDPDVPEIDDKSIKTSVYRQGSRVGEPNDIANAVLYLASDESKFTSGTEIIIDNTVTAMEGIVP